MDDDDDDFMPQIQLRTRPLVQHQIPPLQSSLNSSKILLLQRRNERQIANPTDGSMKMKGIASKAPTPTRAVFIQFMISKKGLNVNANLLVQVRLASECYTSRNFYKLTLFKS